jgi:hypothetical protein
MAMGRKPNDEHAMSNAERQARYRARHAANLSPVVSRPRRQSDRRSRPERWRDAIRELIKLQSQYVDWLAALPDSLQNSDTAEALEAIAELDLESIADIELPRGYGRD